MPIKDKIPSDSLDSKPKAPDWKRLYRDPVNILKRPKTPGKEVIQMKVRTDNECVIFELLTTKEIQLTWEELVQLEKLIKLLRAITDQGTPESLLLKM